MEPGNAGGRKKLEPDPRVRTAILAAANEIVREDGVGALSIAQVLNRSQLGTRALYRHFDSKDQLVSALFLDMARSEVQRLESHMATAPDAVRAVAAWIDGRLDLAFNVELRSDLRQMSMDAQSQMFAAPELVGPAYREMLRPLVVQLENGRDTGLFNDIVPEVEALSIQGVVWSSVERQWATPGCDVKEIRQHVQRFCLRGLGVAPETIQAVVNEQRSTRKPLRSNASK
ncbi:TetR/AcrR family transcriptional regulator [Mycolicibacterium lutetiense]|uniref:TetR/AcrR family transcriptional regulator n=1 Tax=Mycolicibacterium lutetiense TaxID=1641992 RepID=UPI001AEB2A2C|nr:TetR/AcrR family transcriptional regulator [Mycolicibacterium lutetiense]